MTILFMGGDLSSMKSTGFGSDFTGVVAPGTVPFTGLGVRSSGSDLEYVETPTWTPVQELWLHALMWPSSSNEPIYFMDGTDIAIKLDVVSTSGGNFTYGIIFLSAPATYTTAGTFTVPSSTNWFYLDLYIKTGAAGAVAAYVNQSEKLAETAAVMTYAPDISAVRFYGNGPNDVAGIVIADENTIAWRLGRLAPTANGSDTAFIGDVTNIDETTNNDSDYNYSASADQVETYTITTVPASLTGYVPRAVAVSARAKRGSSGPQNMQLVLRSGGTNYFSSTQALGLGHNGFEHIWETNPDTSAAWTSSQLASLQIGVKSIT